MFFLIIYLFPLLNDVGIIFTHPERSMYSTEWHSNSPQCAPCSGSRSHTCVMHSNMSPPTPKTMQKSNIMVFMHCVIHVRSHFLGSQHKRANDSFFFWTRGEWLFDLLFSCKYCFSWRCDYGCLSGAFFTLYCRDFNLQWKASGRDRECCNNLC